jgi:hypothetical protein
MSTEIAPEAAPLSKDAAKKLDLKVRAAAGKVNTNFRALVDLLEQAANGEIRAALGYSSWPAYVRDAVQLTPTDTRESATIVASITVRGKKMTSQPGATA